VAKPINQSKKKPAKHTKAKPATKPRKRTKAKPATKPGKRTKAKPATKPGKHTKAKPATKPRKRTKAKPATKPATGARKETTGGRRTELAFSYGGILRERPAPTAAQLAVTERRVGASLPDDYKAFLAKHNGGAPDRNFLPVGNDAFLIECFLYVDGRQQDIYDVEKASEWPSQTLGEQVVAFASDGSGDQLVLRRSAGAWQVAWWRHDQEPALAPVADSFHQMLQVLVPDPMVDESLD
jgi:hypothetical protein